MLFDNIMRDGQAEARPGMFAGDKRLEDVRQNFRVDARAGIFHCDQDLVLFWQIAGVDREMPAWLHDLGGVEEQVQDHLPQLI